jgi:hypothetical protein
VIAGPVQEAEDSRRLGATDRKEPALPPPGSDGIRASQAPPNFRRNER